MPTVFQPAVAIASRRLAKVDERAARMSRWLYDRRFARAWGPALRITPVAGAPSGHIHCLRLSDDAGIIELLVAADGDATLDFASGDDETADDPLMAIAAMAWCDAGRDGAQVLGLESLRPVALFRLEPRSRVPREGWSVVRDGSRALFSFCIVELPSKVEVGIVSHVATLRGDGHFRKSLELHGAVALARRNIARRLLASLKPGDVLLLDLSDGPLPAAACRLRWGMSRGRHWTAAVQVDDNQITIDGDCCMNEFAETEFSDTDAPTSLDAIELPVRFEVDTVGITLGQVESMAPGQVFALAAPLAGSQLRIVACGQVVGSAELVIVGDRLGARILHMVDSHALQRG